MTMSTNSAYGSAVFSWSSLSCMWQVSRDFGDVGELSHDRNVDPLATGIIVSTPNVSEAGRLRIDTTEESGGGAGVVHRR